MTNSTSATKAPAKLNPTLKMALEIGPLILFFVANARPALFHWIVAPVLPPGITPEKTAILTATAVLMAAVVAALAVSWIMTRHLPIMPVVTAIAVLVFGGLTFVFQDKSFIQIKLTIVDCLFGAALLGGLAFGKLLLPVALDSVMHLDEAGWRKLTIRWGLFFFALAGLNEILRLTLTWDNWVKFKTFGVLPLTLLFALAQTPLILKHEIKPEADTEHF
ncbi:septation protein A [Rhodoblastus acidophilus]|uniref:Inner membrane-spanning protein YciB n=1 Tax=Candidatus Rhodoblastus alkanivorans TaxID=2954117 RepID=A0ABS9Z1T6_9HYPH|nr:septation protein A [Candidatus Rhodoblastus alkanivorans]MCI4678076.1 septation protein A [Candidatus Rhodoblastus alkanivorans]MCI4681583.1 septation protein A [Candidatus Rhodoblastus alkanivorans]MDI4642631.1 septation protein A [Rhodoblastus acidophilus]